MKKKVTSKKFGKTLDIDEELAKELVDAGLYLYMDDKNKEKTDKLELDEAIHWLDKGIEKYEEIEASQTMCDWCNAPATYSNEAYDLCENCSDQLHGI